MKIGILTGGGDCQGLNAAIRSATLSLIHNFGAEVHAIEEGFLGLIDKRTHLLTESDVDTIFDKGGTMIGTCNRASPFNYKGEDVSQIVADYYRELGLDCIIAMGGDGSMTLCYEMSKLGMNFIGVPKTIDNDIAQTDRTFGFDTAVNVAAEAIDRLRTTAQSHKRVMIIETMGRYAGWIALHAGVAGGADLILLPEFPYDTDEIVRKIEERSAAKAYTIVVVAEGAKPMDGELSVEKTIEGSPDPIRLGGIGNYLQSQLESKIDAEVRTTVLGHVQRGGSPSAYDRLIATNVGSYAALLAAKQRYGRLVTIHDNHMSSVALESVAHKIRTVPENNMTLISALAMGVSFGCPSLAIQPDDLNDGDVTMG
ncbi:MAG: ATP-dependent 6-phosphofructokinase [Agarilytica sp.]